MSGLSETSTYNHVHNTLSLFEGSGNLLFTTSKTKHDYISNKLVYTSCLTSCQTTKTQDLRKLGNIKKVSKLYRSIAQCPVPLPLLSVIVKSSSSVLRSHLAQVRKNKKSTPKSVLYFRKLNFLAPRLKNYFIFRNETFLYFRKELSKCEK